MGVCFPSTSLAKHILCRSALTSTRAASTSSDVLRGFFAVYVRENQKQWFVVLVPYLNQSPFQNLLTKAKEEFRFHHPTGGLTIPCRAGTFINVTSHLSNSQERGQNAHETIV